MNHPELQLGPYAIGMPVGDCPNMARDLGAPSTLRETGTTHPTSSPVPFERVPPL